MILKIHHMLWPIRKEIVECTVIDGITQVIDSPTPGGALQGKYTLHLCADWFLALQALIVIESSVLLNSFSQGVFLLMLFLHLSL